MSAVVRIVPAADGGSELELELAGQELGLLRTLLDQLAALLAEDAPGDPALDRLFPAGYRDDAAAAAEFRQYTRSGLVDHKSTGVGAVLAALADAPPIRLRPEEAARWLPVLTDLRLVLAERLGIRHDDDRGEGLMAEVYDWVGALQWNLVEALDASAAEAS